MFIVFVAPAMIALLPRGSLNEPRAYASDTACDAAPSFLQCTVDQDHQADKSERRRDAEVVLSDPRVKRAFVQACADRGLRKVLLLDLSGNVWIWDTKERIGAVLDGTKRHSAVSCASDGSFAILGGEDGSLCRLSLRDHQTVAKTSAHSKPVFGLLVSGDRKVVTSAGADGHLRTWELGDKFRLTDDWVHRGSVNCAVYYDKQQAVISGCADGVLREWKRGSKETMRAVDMGAPVLALASAPAGKLIAAAGPDDKIRVYDWERGVLRYKISAHQEWVRALAISKNSKWLLSAGSDKTIRIWELETGKRIEELRGHQMTVECLVIGEEARRVISAGADMTIRIWDLQRRLR